MLKPGAVKDVQKILSENNMHSFVIGEIKPLQDKAGYEFGGKGSAGGGCRMVGEYAK